MDPIRYTKWDRMLNRTGGQPTENSFMLLRNLAFGGAAACLVVLTQIIPLGVTADSLRISVYSAAAGMPFFVGAGGIFEFFITLEKPSYSFMWNDGPRILASGLLLLGGASILGVIGGVTWYLSSTAFWIFVAATVFTLLYVSAFQAVLGLWWYREGGPGATETDE